MRDSDSGSSDYERGFAAGYEAGRRNRGWSGHLLAVVVSVFLLSILVANLCARPPFDGRAADVSTRIESSLDPLVSR